MKCHPNSISLILTLALITYIPKLTLRIPNMLK